MTWWRRECGFSSTPAGRAAGLKGRALWAEGIDHCTQNLTDGRIDKHMLPLLSAVAEVGTGRPEARKLVDVGLWVDMGDHWQIPNWNDYQPHRADVEAVKAKKKLAGAEGNHKRWHTDRGIVSDDCEFCHPNPIANGSHCANETRSQTDRHVTARHDTMIRSSSESTHAPPSEPDDDTTATARTAATTLGSNDHQRAVTDGVSIGNHDAYRAECIARRLPACLDAAREHPAWTAARIAAHLGNPAPLEHDRPQPAEITADQIRAEAADAGVLDLQAQRARLAELRASRRPEPA